MPRKGEDTRQTILTWAVRKAAEVGLEGLTIGELARELKMSKSGLYAHFGSKEALQVAVLEQAAEAFTDVVIRPALKAPRGEPRVRALYEAWIAWHEAHQSTAGCLLVAAASELDDRPGPARDRLIAQQRDLMDFIVGALELAKREGHFRPDLDAQQVAFETYGILLMYHLSTRLLGQQDAVVRARKAIERLLKDASSQKH